MENVKGAFGLVRPSEVREKRVLLIDDVFTTGATMNECARVLKEAGAASVTVLTLARTAE
jgi:predicted amidophosphoribosyltransferase